MDILFLQKKYPLQYGASTPILRKKADEVVSFGDELLQFSDDLLTLMREYEGVGLAAPQIGISQRIAAFTQRDTSKRKRKLLQEGVMINPVVVGQSKDQAIEEEGCLSLPGIAGSVPRSTEITVQYFTPQGKKTLHQARGYNARIMLHEIDHLDGILFIDKIV